MIHASRKKVLLKVAVMLDTGDGEQFAYLLVPPALEADDVLNDARAFLPIERVDGTTAIIAKTCIRSVVPVDSGRQVDPIDPHDVLGVDPCSSDDALQESYHRAVRAVHPDRVGGLGLPPEFMEMATRSTARLNDAYGKIKALRKTAMRAA